MSTPTVRDIDPADKPWLRREARDVGVSTEEFVHSLTHAQRNKTERRAKPSEAFARHFGERHGELPTRARYRHSRPSFTEDNA